MKKSIGNKGIEKKLGVEFNKPLLKNKKEASCWTASMQKKAEKVVVIGLDAPIVKSVLRLVQEGKLPNIKRLIDEGVWAENCLVPYPTITPPNWTTIATGAWAGTHGITCFHLSESAGIELDKPYQAFLTQDCQAEYIWESAEKIGKKSIIVNYPTTWPPIIKQGIQLGGAGLYINEWRVDRNNKGMPGWTNLVSIADEQLISTEEYPFSDIVELEPAKDWLNIPQINKSLEAKFKVGYRNTFDSVESQEWYVLIQDKQEKGYDTISVSKTKDAKDIMFSIREGEWSKKIYTEFKVNKESKKAVFMAKLIELSPDAERFKLYFTEFCQLDGFSYPKEIAKELEHIQGLPTKASGEGFTYGWYDINTWNEKVDLVNIWLGESIYHLLKNYQWDMFFMHEHTPDHAYHTFINKLDSMVCKEKDEIIKYKKVEEKFYQSIDRMIGRILQAVDERTLVIIVSDHGATSTEGRFDKDHETFDVDKILEKAGLLVYKEEQEKKVIDWQKTKAVGQRSVYIYVNLKERDPEGIVEPEDYDKIRDEIINALYNYTDSKTGKKPIAVAIKKEDARILGLYGDRIGDIVYALRPEIGTEHGRHLPTAEYGVTSMKGLLVICGPNIKKNHILKRTVWLTDIVPTICYLLDMPVPKDAEGGIIYQALENPDFKYKEIKRLQENYERLKSALEVQKSLTHDYK